MSQANYDPAPPRASDRFLDGIALALLVVGIWSVVGIAAGVFLHHPPTTWRFIWALIGSGVTLVAISIYQVKQRD